MKKTLMDIEIVWKKNLGNKVYYCSISGSDTSPEAMGCTVDGTMHVFNNRGKLLLQSEIPSIMSCVFLARIRGIERLMTGDIHGIIRNISREDGHLVWQKKISDPIVSMDVGDINADGRDDVIVILQSNRVVSMEADGKTEMDFGIPGNAIDCSTLPRQPGIAALLDTGAIIISENSGAWKELFVMNGNPTSMKSIIHCGEPLLVFGFNDGNVKFVDMEGYERGRIGLEGRVRCIARSTPVSDNRVSFVIIASGDGIASLRCSSNGMADTRLATKQDETRKIQVEGTRITVTRKCPECGLEIDASIKYCEYCGTIIQ